MSPLLIHATLRADPCVFYRDGGRSTSTGVLAL
jgi:hypothetical protein